MYYVSHVGWLCELIDSSCEWVGWGSINFKGRFMCNVKLFLLASLLFVLSGCVNNKESVPILPDQQVSDYKIRSHEHLLNSDSSDAVSIVSSWAPNSYYARLHTESFGLQSGINKCKEMSSLIKGLKAYFGVSNATGFYVTVDIVNGHEKIANDILILSYMVDDLNNEATTCSSESLKGYLTPYFKVNSSLDLKISYEIKYINSNNIETIKKLQEKSNSILSYFSPKSVGLLTSDIFEKVIGPLDDSIEKSMNVVATDTLNSHFTLNTPVGQTRIDRSTLDFGSTLPEEISEGGKIGVQVGLLYYKSVIGMGSPEVIYDDDPSQILTSINDNSNNNMDVFTALLKNKVEGVSANELKSFTTKEEKQYIEKACKNIKQYSSSILGLTREDALIVRWAILTEFSKYNNNLDIRTDDCFKKDELVRLSTLNRYYIFRYYDEVMKVGRKKYVSDLMSNFGKSAILGAKRDIYDGDKLILSIALSEPLPNDILEKLDFSDNYDQSILSFEGEDDVMKTLPLILSNVQCGMISEVEPHYDLAFVGVLRTADKTPKYILGGLNMIRYNDKQKITQIFLADYGVIDTYISPYKGWLDGVSGNCPGISEQIIGHSNLL